MCEIQGPLIEYLAQHELPVHVHGEVAEVEQHLVSGELLLCHVVSVQDDDGHAQEQVEVVRLRREERNGTARSHCWKRNAGIEASVAFF